jgi:hypothetical protein
MQHSCENLFKCYYIYTTILINIFKFTLYSICFDRHWSSSGVLKLFVETAVLAFCASNIRFVVLSHIRVFRRAECFLLLRCVFGPRVSCFSSCWVFSPAALCVWITTVVFFVVLCVSSCWVVCLDHLMKLVLFKYIISRLWCSHGDSKFVCSPLKLNWHFGWICRHHFQGRRISQARKPEWSSVTSFMLVSCLAYFSVLKIMATYSSEMSVDFQRTTR